MEAKNIGGKRLLVEMTTEEAALLANALNEALEGVESFEFGTRLGATPEAAEALAAQLRSFLALAPSPEVG